MYGLIIVQGQVGLGTRWLSPNIEFEWCITYTQPNFQWFIILDSFLDDKSSKMLLTIKLSIPSCPDGLITHYLVHYIFLKTWCSSCQELWHHSKSVTNLLDYSSWNPYTPCRRHLILQYKEYKFQTWEWIFTMFPICVKMDKNV